MSTEVVEYVIVINVVDLNSLINHCIRKTYMY